MQKSGYRHPGNPPPLMGEETKNKIHTFTDPPPLDEPFDRLELELGFFGTFNDVSPPSSVNAGNINNVF